MVNTGKKTQRLAAQGLGLQAPPDAYGGREGWGEVGPASVEAGLRWLRAVVRRRASTSSIITAGEGGVGNV